MAMHVTFKLCENILFTTAPRSTQCCFFASINFYLARISRYGSRLPLLIEPRAKRKCSYCRAFSDWSTFLGKAFSQRVFVWYPLFCVESFRSEQRRI